MSPSKSYSLLKVQSTGHDWGCGAVWSFAEHYPTRCIGAAGLAVPSHVIEQGLEELMKFVNREIYPEDKFPWAQW